MFSFFRKPKAPVQRDLEQVIFDIAEKQSDDDFSILYQLMQDRHVLVPVNKGSMPSKIVPGVKYVTDESDQIQVKSVTMPTGDIAIPAATHEDAAMLQDGYCAMEWPAFLSMVLKLDNSVYGALLQGKRSWIAFDRSRISSILGSEWGLPGHLMPTDFPAVSQAVPKQKESHVPTDFVVVPPGHRVVAFRPTSVAHVNGTESGSLIVDYGESGNWRDTNAQLDKALSTHLASAVVILQRDMIDRLRGSNELAVFLGYWKAAKERDVSAVWVLPLDASLEDAVIASIHDTGYGVHGSASDGACFVEVHKSDGSITVCMPGPVLQRK